MCKYWRGQVRSLRVKSGDRKRGTATAAEFDGVEQLLYNCKTEQFEVQLQQYAVTTAVGQNNNDGVRIEMEGFSQPYSWDSRTSASTVDVASLGAIPASTNANSATHGVSAPVIVNKNNGSILKINVVDGITGDAANIQDNWMMHFSFTPIYEKL